MHETSRMLLRIAERLTTRRYRDTLLCPLIADLQHEWAEARASRLRRAAALLSGAAGLLVGTALYGLHLPARHVREIWSEPGAPAPGLLRAASGPLLVYTLILLVTHSTIGMIRSGWRFLPDTIGPGVFIWFPAALAVAVGRTIAQARDDAEKRRWTRAAPGIALLGFTLCLAWAFLLVGPYRRLVHPLPVANESHLGRVAASVQGRARPSRSFDPQGRAVQTNPPSEHWLARPAVCISLMALAVAVAWSTQPQLLPLAVFLAFLVAHTLTPQPWPPWHFHAVPLTLAAIVAVFGRKPTVAVWSIDPRNQRPSG
jgi:hypothetical protein